MMTPTEKTEFQRIKNRWNCGVTFKELKWLLRMIERLDGETREQRTFELPNPVIVKTRSVHVQSEAGAFRIPPAAIRSPLVASKPRRARSKARSLIL